MRARSGYARDTWQSFVEMAVPATGLPADKISVDTHTRSAFTSPTNVAAYLWATMAAKELRFISADEATERMRRTLATLATLERHEDSGMFYNWYDPVTGEKLRSGPRTARPCTRSSPASTTGGWPPPC